MQKVSSIWPSMLVKSEWGGGVSKPLSCTAFSYRLLANKIETSSSAAITPTLGVSIYERQMLVHCLHRAAPVMAVHFFIPWFGILLRLTSFSKLCLAWLRATRGVGAGGGGDGLWVLVRLRSLGGARLEADLEAHLQRGQDQDQQHHHAHRDQNKGVGGGRRGVRQRVLHTNVGHRRRKRRQGVAVTG